MNNNYDNFLKANQYKLKGNEYMQKFQYFQALDMYSEAI